MVVEASPTVAGAVTRTWVRGGARIRREGHPMGRYLDDLRVGDSLTTGPMSVPRDCC